MSMGKAKSKRKKTDKRFTSRMFGGATAWLIEMIFSILELSN
jgi:hypothetical protein